MARKKKPLPLFEKVTITDIAAEGKSLVRITIPEHDGIPERQLVVFVPFCVPGDVVDLQITRKKHNYAEANVLRFIKFSDVRSIPKCEHFGICGGCKWQNLPYEEQLKAKQKQVYDQLTRIGHLELPKPENISKYEMCVTSTKSDGTLSSRQPSLFFYPILGSKKQYEYRNKLDFGFSNKRWLTQEEIKSGKEFDDMNACGFHITGAFDKIYPISKCWLMDDLHNKIRNAVYNYAIEHHLTFYDLRTQHGLLRDLIIRNSNSGEWMVILQFHFDHNNKANDQAKALALLQYISERFPEISSLLYLDNQKCNDTIGDQDIITFKGNDYIFELMENLQFKVGPKSFYQTNTEQAYILYSVIREFAFEGKERHSCVSIDHNDSFGYRRTMEQEKLPLVYDLYTGTGTIANFIAKYADKVIGIEYVPEAIEDAKINSQINGINNTLFFAGDMKKILTNDFISKHGRPDIVITDPPRAGMHQDVVNIIMNAGPQRIVYVSCNPATQARDLVLLCHDYKIRSIQPVDMFPHTPHVENVVLLDRK